jgi:hypothetical protein
MPRTGDWTMLPPEDAELIRAWEHVPQACTPDPESGELWQYMDTVYMPVFERWVHRFRHRHLAGICRHYHVAAPRTGDRTVVAPPPHMQRTQSMPKLKASAGPDIDDGVYDATILSVEVQQPKAGAAFPNPYLRWTFSVFDTDTDTELVGNSSYNFSLKSKTYKWACAVLAKQFQPGEELDTDDLSLQDCQVIVKRDIETGFVRIEDVLGVRRRGKAAPKSPPRQQPEPDDIPEPAAWRAQLQALVPELPTAQQKFYAAVALDESIDLRKGEEYLTKAQATLATRGQENGQGDILL